MPRLFSLALRPPILMSMILMRMILTGMLLMSAAIVIAVAQGQSGPTTAPFPPSNPPSPATALTPGKVSEAVPCVADPTQTYALYLPTAYSASKSWPILYVFDPEGRGRIPVNLYKDVVEKYGFILAASNNSRNFQSEAAAYAARILWDDTHTRFNLDPRRLYTMGFSGGARVATALAVRCQPCAIAGVIAHGAGYPFPPSGTEHFAYFAFIGNRDFNWPEIMELRRQKEQSGSAYRLKIFPGGHQWAPPSLFSQALDWLQVKAMQSGAFPRDAAFLDRVFADTEKEAADAASAKDPITEFDAYRSLVSDFAGLKDVSEYQRKLDALKDSRDYKRGLKALQNAIDQQQALTKDLSSDIARLADADSDLRLSLRNNIADGMNSLNRRSAHAKTENEGLIFSRAFDALWVQGIEAGQAQLEKSKHFADAELYFRLMASVTPDQPWPYLLLAETAVARGDKKQANKELREALNRGLKNPDTLEDDINLQPLRTDTDFQQLLADLKARRESQPQN